MTLYFWKFDPFLLRLGAFYYRFDESHANNAIANIGEIVPALARIFPSDFVVDGDRDSIVDVGEGFDEEGDVGAELPLVEGILEAELPSTRIAMGWL